MTLVTALLARLRPPLRPAELERLYLQLATMQSAGVPVLQSLDTLGRQDSGRLGKALSGIARDVYLYA